VINSENRDCRRGYHVAIGGEKGADARGGNCARSDLTLHGADRGDNEPTRSTSASGHGTIGSGAVPRVHGRAATPRESARSTEGSSSMARSGNFSKVGGVKPGLAPASSKQHLAPAPFARGSSVTHTVDAPASCVGLAAPATKKHGAPAVARRSRPGQGQPDMSCTQLGRARATSP